MGALTAHLGMMKRKHEGVRPKAPRAELHYIFLTEADKTTIHLQFSEWTNTYAA